MIVYIKPSRARGAVTAPPSKSEAHRALICAALSGGCRVDNVEQSDDIKATLGALEALGAKARIGKNSVTLGGLSAEKITDTNIFANESGSTLRFILPLCMISSMVTRLRTRQPTWKRFFQPDGNWNTCMSRRWDSAMM